MEKEQRLQPADEVVDLSHALHRLRQTVVDLAESARTVEIAQDFQMLLFPAGPNDPWIVNLQDEWPLWLPNVLAKQSADYALSEAEHFATEHAHESGDDPEPLSEAHRCQILSSFSDSPDPALNFRQLGTDNPISTSTERCVHLGKARSDVEACLKDLSAPLLSQLDGLYGPEWRPALVAESIDRLFGWPSPQAATPGDARRRFPTTVFDFARLATAVSPLGVWSEVETRLAKALGHLHSMRLEPAASTRETNGKAAKLLPSHASALACYQYAVATAEYSLKTDDEAHSWLIDHGTEHVPQVTDDYELPSRETFRTYLSKARKASDASKNMPRHGRARSSRSIVNQNEC